jgi:protein-tyrosine kinase
MQQLFLNVLRRWLWLLILAALVTALAGYLSVKDRPPTYQANVKLLVGPGIDAPNPDLGALRTGGQLMQTYAELVETSPLLEAIITDLKLDVSPRELGKLIDVGVNQDTQILIITVTDEKPDQAIAIANAAADEMVRRSPSADDSATSIINQQMLSQATRLEQIIAISDAAIGKLEADLTTLAENESQGLIVLQTDDYLAKQRLIIEQLSQERGRLSDALTALAQLYESLKVTPTNQVRIVEPANSSTMIDGQLRSTVLVSALAGLVLGLVIAFSFEYIHNVVGSLEELSRAAGVPALGEINAQQTPIDGRARTGLLKSHTVESYQMLSTKLMLANNKAPLRSILIISSDPDHNSAEIAANLAITFSQIGKQTILADGNLRKPSIHQLFNLNDRTRSAGLFAQKTEQVYVESVDEIANLTILPGDPVSQDSPEQAEPSRISSIVGELERRADIVIISAAPPMVCAESLLLASLVGGVILVVCQAEISHKAVAEVVESLRLLDAHVVGAVLDKGGSHEDGSISRWLSGLALTMAGTDKFARRFAGLFNLASSLKAKAGRLTWLGVLNRRSLP